MKKIVVLVIAVLFCFCACDSDSVVTGDDTIALVGDSDMLGLQGGLDDENAGFFIGSWLSYIEALPKNMEKTEENFSKHIDSIMKNLKKAGINNLFVQVRPFCDAIYPSQIFPSSCYAVKNQGDKLPFDFFSVIIEKAKECDIAVHAWINPYRVQIEFDLDELYDESFAKKWYLSKSENIKEAAGGLYLDPASIEVQQKIIAGVKELLDNYDIAGIHIDDYFYPTAEKDFDKAFFDEYKKQNGNLSLSQWRRENVTALLSSIYTTVKSYGDDKLFTVSPCGNIEKNETQLYADVKLWCSQKGYCDMIIPQIYFGFENETSPFEKCALSWKSIVSSNVKLCAGLALYKSGKEDKFAGSGKSEWCDSCDIIKRQVEFAKENGFCGICLYSASFVTFNETFCGKETQNLCNVL